MQFFATIAFAVLMSTYPLFATGKTGSCFLCRLIIPTLALAMGVAELAAPVYSLRVIAHATAVTVLVFAVFTLLFKSFRRKYFPMDGIPSLKTRCLDVISLFILILAFSGLAKVIEL